jgi:hypothetical protein
VSCERCVDVASLGLAESGGVAEHVERVFRLLHLRRWLAIATIRKNDAELFDYGLCWKACEDAAYRTIKVQQ